MIEAPRAVFALITPARNEARHIATTIESVAAQTARPARWVIVSDASTDGTDEIVAAQSQGRPWITLVRKRERSGAYFASQIATFNAGLRQLDGVTYDFIGKLDGDIRLEPDYYAQILARFAADPQLGAAGGGIIECFDGRQEPLRMDARSVAGAVHLFRRSCFEAIGGFVELPYGGYDTVAEVSARMRGWTTRTFHELPVYHLKPISASEGRTLRRLWRRGMRDYSIGNHPMFEIVKCAGRCLDRPPLAGSIIWLCGYAWLWLRRAPRAVSREYVRFHQWEQLSRLGLGRWIRPPALTPLEGADGR